MGINTGLANLLVRARIQGAVFSDMVTIGRQSIAVPPHELTRLARQLNMHTTPAARSAGFADDFFRDFLAADHISAIDYSDYQQADIVHDLNQPIPEQLANRFDALVDGGSLEHIFDVRQALENYMRLVRTGGSIFILTTANNLCGHGFYQFSPELFYRVFDAANGFSVRDVVIIESPLLSLENSRTARYFHVNDPSAVRKRVQLVNRWPTAIFVHAQKMEERPLFASPPLQSDYDKIKWRRNRAPEAGGQTAEQQQAATFRYLPRWEETRRRFRQWRKSSSRNKRFFTRMKF
jgi:hypothetical protein